MADDHIPAPGQNTGVVDASPPAGGWVADQETGAAPTILQSSKQYDLYLPDEEAQAIWTPYVFDTFACVSFSALNSLEIIVNFLRSNAKLPATHEAFLVNEGYVNKQTNKVNFSDRFTAKMSGTTQNGNSLGVVAESIRKLHGVLPEQDWAFPVFTPEENADGAKKWARFYQEIPQSLQNKARRFLDYFEISYQWVIVGTADNAKLRSYLPFGPIQLVSSICPPWNSTEASPPIAACGCSTQHATTLYGDQSDALKLFDHYKSFKKLLAPDYCIPYAVQYYVAIKTFGAPSSFHYVFNTDLQLGMPATAEVHKLQEALQYLRRADGTPYMKAGTFGAYGPATRAAVALFQSDHGINPPEPGRYFASLTRAKINPLVA